MDGIGSGNWLREASKATITSRRAIDIRYLKKQGLLNQSSVGLLSWTIKGTRIGELNYQIKETGIRLSYKSRINDADKWLEVDSLINFDYTDCHYGGKRAWLICPNSDCNRRVTSIYSSGTLFLCRHCCKLNYLSQHQSHLDRQMSKSHAIRKTLGGKEGFLYDFPDKPKGMHWKTYNKLYQQAMEGERCFDLKAEFFLSSKRN